MKGIVFTEFLEMVESRFSQELADEIIDACAPPSGAAYTAVGTYDYRELLQLVSELSRATSVPVPVLVNGFGHYLFGRFVELDPQLFAGIECAFDFLMNIEKYIHAEVKKIYPDAELPEFDCRPTGPHTMEMVYRSSRPFADLAEGLILGCAEHFREQITIERVPVLGTEKNGIRFSLTRTSAWTT